MTEEKQKLINHKGPLSIAAAAFVAGSVFCICEPSYAKGTDVTALERRVAQLNRELEQAQQALAAAKQQASLANEKAAKAEAELATRDEPKSDDIEIGPVTVGGAVRVNYTSYRHKVAFSEYLEFQRE